MLASGGGQEIEVSKLIKGRPLDNMEFLQWLKLYFDQVTGGAGISGYDAEQRRALSKGGNGFMKSSKSRRGRPSPPFPSLPLPSPARRPPLADAHPSSHCHARAEKPISSRPKSSSAPQAPLVSQKKKKAKAAEVGVGGSKGRLQDLEEKNTSLKHTLDSVEQERDFFFSKLRDIEIICTDKDVQNDPVS